MLNQSRRRSVTSPVSSPTVTRRLIAAQEAERRRIARELHDDISQRLALLSVELDQMARDAPGNATVRRRWRDLSRAAGEIASDLHRVSHSLHPARLETLGLVATIAGFCQELWIQRHLRVRFAHDNVPRLIAPDVALGIYRTVQEGLENVLRHSGATEADVSLTCTGDELVLRVDDDGVGFTLQAQNESGFGLVTMNERINAVGGTLSVQAAPNRGTHLLARVNLRCPLTPGAMAG